MDITKRRSGTAEENEAEKMMELKENIVNLQMIVNCLKTKSFEVVVQRGGIGTKKKREKGEKQTGQRKKCALTVLKYMEGMGDHFTHIREEGGDVEEMGDEDEFDHVALEAYMGKKVETGRMEKEEIVSKGRYRKVEDKDGKQYVMMERVDQKLAKRM
ncbi:hypothetical protein FQR65_LT01326 [Abscondita terminalis]|nr:hypothetical protein FQR65_LT01326 [Abscondita terminalis]